MLHRSLFFAALLIGCVPSLVHAQEAQQTQMNPMNGQRACEQQKTDFASLADFSASPIWRSVRVKSGNFSVNLPFSDKWKMSDQALLPYTLYDNGSGGAEITINGQSSNKTRAIHFGRYRMDDVMCSSDISLSTLMAMTSVREFSLGWEPVKSLTTVIKTAQASSKDVLVPVSVKIGKHEGILLHGKVDLLGVSCVQDTLWFNAKGKTFNLSSTCRPISFDMLRVAASIK